MKKYVFSMLMAVLAMFVLEPAAYATTASGKIWAIRINKGATPSRMSIMMGKQSVCGNFWYSIESLRQDELSFFMSSALMGALRDKANVQIVGTDACDEYNVERVREVDVYPGN